MCLCYSLVPDKINGFLSKIDDCSVCVQVYCCLPSCRYIGWMLRDYADHRNQMVNCAIQAPAPINRFIFVSQCTWSHPVLRRSRRSRTTEHRQHDHIIHMQVRSQVCTCLSKSNIKQTLFGVPHNAWNILYLPNIVPSLHGRSRSPNRTRTRHKSRIKFS